MAARAGVHLSRQQLLRDCARRCRRPRRKRRHGPFSCPAVRHTADRHTLLGLWLTRLELDACLSRVSQIDQFKHPKSGRESRCYRIMYRSMDRSLTNQQVNVLQEQVRADVVKQLGVEIR